MKKEDIPTKKMLRDAIPKECFEYSIPTSLALVVRDGLVIGSLWYVAWNYLNFTGLSALDWLQWNVFWFLSGTALTGWWVLAHECGHGGFSDNELLNDCVGWVLHSLLLVPYFSWKYSHGKHHKNTNHLLDGESHVPPGRSYVKLFKKMHDVIGEDAFAAWELFTHLVLGWPMYLFFNATGARREPNQNGQVGAKITTVHDHFRPTSRLFPRDGKLNFKIFLSTVGCLATLAGLYFAGDALGHGKVAMMYWPSYLWVNFWLVLYTWLQHTAPDLPHFGDDAATPGDGPWNWERGALCTIDRPYGPFDWMHHHIGSTHVAHHCFHEIPCYNAVKATAALKAYLEPKGLYHYDPTPFPLAAWRIAHDCHYVEEVHGIQMYKSLKNAPKDASNKGKKAE